MEQLHAGSGAGAGPNERDVAPSAIGMLRCRMAALRYFEGLAPFLVVSGGKVHPYKTMDNEAPREPLDP